MKLTVASIFLAAVTHFARAEIEPLTFHHENPLVVRNYVSDVVAQQLYKDLRFVGIPSTQVEDIHPRLVSTLGDAGTKVEEEPPAHEAIDALYQPESKESAVFRLEHLRTPVYDESKELVNELVPNNVMEDGGTIHLYVSSPGASALANHTDTTDIFVLHLDGAKEWMLCEEHEEDNNDVLTYKLDTCSTYGQREIDTLKCHRETLYPGDALFLPKRVVHSARAVSEHGHVPSAHLTFGFFEETTTGQVCSETYSDLPFLKTGKERKLACNANCWDECNGDIFQDCDTHCNTGSCDSDCDGSCDSWGFWSCDKSCDKSCDTGCPQ